MNKILLTLIISATIGIVHAQNENIPDAIFKAVLVGNTAINTNGDAEIQVSEASAFGGTIFCASLGISDLTGIEAFTALTILNCSSNLITSLDVSQNTALTVLWCPNNQLTTLDVSNNTALTYLDCEWNQLTCLNVKNGNNQNMTGFNAFNNPNLACIEVDDAAWSTANWTNIDTQSFFSEDCGVE